jgi:hypothetical protein
MPSNPSSDRSSFWSQAISIPFYLGFIAFLLFFFEWLIGMFGHTFGMVIYGVASFVVISGFLFFTYMLRNFPEVVGYGVAEDDFGATVWYYLVLLLIFVPVYSIAFGEFSRQLNFLYGGFDAPGAGFWDWAWYGFSWIVDTVSFNASEIFSFSLSAIHASALWSQVLVLAYNVTLALVVIAAIVQFYNFLRRLSAQTAADDES